MEGERWIENGRMGDGLFDVGTRGIRGDGEYTVVVGEWIGEGGGVLLL